MPVGSSTSSAPPSTSDAAGPLHPSCSVALDDRCRAAAYAGGMAGRRRAASQRDRVLALPLTLPGALLTHPFGDDVNVYKGGATSRPASGGRHSGGKMFCLVS